MKMRFALLFSMLSSISVSAQFEWIGDYYFSGQASALFRTSSNQYVLLHSGWFTVFDSTGAEVLAYEPAPHNSIGGVLELADSSIVFLGIAGCNSLFSTFLKFDKNWTSLTPTPEPYLTAYGNRGRALSDGSFLAFNPHEIERLTKDGVQIWLKPINGYWINDIAIAVGDTLIAATKKGLLILDSNGDSIDLVQGFLFDRLETNSEGNYIGITKDSVYLLSLYFGLLKTVALPGETIKDFDIGENRLALITLSQHVYLFDLQLNPLNNFPLNTPAHFDLLTLAPDGLVLAGNAAYGTGHYTRINNEPILKKFGFDGSAIQITRDAGVTDVSFNQTPVIVPQDLILSTITFQDVFVEILNYGDSTINEVRVKSRFQYIPIGSEECEPIIQEHTRSFSGLSLLPGESKTLNCGAYEIWFASSSNPLPFEFCAWTSYPDGKLEQDRSNDVFCSDFLVNDDEVIGPDEMELLIFPNPVADLLNFNMISSKPFKDGRFRITDFLGRVIKEFNDTPGATKTISVLEWAAGVYFLQYIGNGEVRCSEKFIKN